MLYKFKLLLFLTASSLLLTACSNKTDSTESSVNDTTAPVTTASETAATEAVETEPVFNTVSETGFPDNYTEIPENAAYKKISYYCFPISDSNFIALSFYDSFDNPLLEVMEINGELLTTKCSYKYNEDGTVAEKTIVSDSDRTDIIVYEYNSDGTLAKETEQRDGEFYNSVAYTYDGHAEPVLIEYSFAESEYDNDRELSYEYDENGRVSVKITDCPKNNTYSEEQYIYNESGNLATKTTSGTTKTVYSYDEDNHLIQEDQYSILDKWSHSVKYVYEFY